MLGRFLFAFLTFLCVFSLGASLNWNHGKAVAKEIPRLEAYRDWSVFLDKDASVKTCWVATTPVKSKISRKNARRGKIFLMVLNRPENNVKNEVTFVSGYPLKEGVSVKMFIGKERFEMFTSGEGAWFLSNDEDNSATRAMKKGANAVVHGVSTRGTKTVDTFSLFGFSKAVDRARELCK